MRTFLSIAAPILTGLGLLAMPGFAQTAPGLEDMVGARAGQAEGALQLRGYRFIRTTTGDDRKWSYWWNDAQRQCVSIATVNGRYDSIVATPAPDCGQRQSDSGNRPEQSSRPDPGYRPQPDRPGRPDYVQPGDRDGFQVAGRRIDLGLVCFGDGQRPALATRYGWSWNDRRDRYDFGNRTELTTQQFDASIMFQLGNDGGRVRLPKKLIPPINSRGNDGWWDLYDVSVRPDTITATYRLNGLNKPRITINRRSGRIAVQGSYNYGFRGTCDMIDGRDHRRF